ncbi:MAG: hypothetical protein JWL73_1830 [Actinomycetia bacterium]|nr:hypothetical protein [Actinomycetes bacterium]
MKLFSRKPSIAASPYRVDDPSSLDFPVSGRRFLANGHQVAWGSERFDLADVTEWTMDMSGRSRQGRMSGFDAEFRLEGPESSLSVPFGNTLTTEEGGAGSLRDAWALYATLRDFGYLQVAPRIVPELAELVRAGGAVTWPELSVTGEGIERDTKKGAETLPWADYADCWQPKKHLGLPELSIRYRRSSGPKRTWAMIPAELPNVYVLPALLAELSGTTTPDADPGRA